MAYGSPEGVAALAKTWTDGGEFIDPDLYGEGGTPTTLAEVTEWLDQVSAFMDAALGEFGFVTPVTHLTALKVLDLRVNAMVADLVNLAHGKGRLLSERIQESGVSPQTVIERELLAWVKARINAFEVWIPRIVDADSALVYSVKATRQK